MGSIGQVIQRAQRVLGLAHVEMDRLLQRQYLPRTATNTRSALSHRSLLEELDCALRSAREFSETTRQQITHLVRWERNFLRGEVEGSSLPPEFQSELEALISECEIAKRSIKARLEEFQSWPTDARGELPTPRVPDSRREIPRIPVFEGIPVSVAERWATLEQRRASLEQRRASLIQLRSREYRANADTRAETNSQTPASATEVFHDPTADGLGDRLRSATPENDADAWDTMRMTLEPDDRLPSVDSSFTSAAAAASFSATTDGLGSGSGSGSTSASISANTSRTSLTVPSDAEDECGPEDDEHRSFFREHQRSGVDSPPPEVLPSPLFRDMRRSARASSRRNMPDAEDLQMYRADRRLPPLAGHTSTRNRDHIPTYQPYTGGSQITSRSAGSFMFSAPRSQSPLSFVSNNGVSTGPSPDNIDMTYVDDSMVFDLAMPRLTSQSPPPSARRQPPTPSTDVSAVMRLAFRYAAAVASSSDPHADPELEHLRRMFSTVANNDGHLNEDWWMSAGVASYLAEDTPNPDEASRGEN